MGLFESKEPRNLRVIQEAGGYVLSKAQAYACDDTVLTCVSSWMSGAGSLAIFLLEDESLQKAPFRKAWRKGDRRKALKLLEVCLYPMFSIWFRKMKDEGDEQTTEMKSNAIENIQYLLETQSKTEVRDFINLDIQYNYDMDKYENAPKGEGGVSLLHYIVLFMSKTWKAVGLREYIDWEKQTFPVRGHADLRLLGQGDYLMGDYRSLFSILAYLPVAGTSMFRAYQQLQDRQK